MAAVKLLLATIAVIIATAAAQTSPSPDQMRPQSTCATGRSACINFPRVLNHLLNHQVGLEIGASFAYKAIAMYFARDDVGLRGMHRWFNAMSAGEADHAKKFMAYINARGGDLQIDNINFPTKTEWNGPLEAVQDALGMEILVQNILMDIHQAASENNDPQLAAFIDKEFLLEQVEAVDMLSHYITILGRLEDNFVATYVFDEQVFQYLR